MTSSSFARPQLVADVARQLEHQRGLPGRRHVGAAAARLLDARDAVARLGDVKPGVRREFGTIEQQMHEADGAEAQAAGSARDVDGQ